MFTSQIERRFEKDKSNEQAAPSFAATFFSFIGDCRNAHTYFDKGNDLPGKMNSEDSLRFLRMKPASARNYIIERSKTEQVVMINEAHHVPQHRVFTLSLLQAMYDNGFRYFGAETLSNLGGILDPNPMDSLRKRGYPTLETGYYTVEPQYGELIRAAVKIGFKVFAYEAYKPVPKEREIGQARNIQKVLLDDPKARILVHCGYAHINEDSLGGVWGKAMAGRFREFTGINPLTINQQTLTERSRPEMENPYYRMMSLTEPSVFLNEKGDVFAGYKGEDGVTAYDIRVAHPRTKYVNGRPDWLQMNGQRKPHFVSHKSLNKIGYPCLQRRKP
ncbi:MAG: hypothetical protein MUD08_14550 [Cytophagales bacterium]|nr:hypothetical protein [Cytophagales bacterium]